MNVKTIPLHLLHALNVFSKSISLKEASEALGMSQPGLSKQLALLESLLPQRAFVTEGKRKALTPYARSIADEFERRFRGLPETLTQITSEHTSPELATIRITGRREILDRFADQMTFPGRVIFNVLGNSETTEALLTGKTDFGVTWKQPDSTEIVARPIFTERYQVVVPKALAPRFPHAKMRETATHLLNLTCLTYKESDAIFQRFFAHYDLKVDELVIRRTTANYQNLVRMIDTGLGWSIVPVHYRLSESRNWILPISESVGLSRQFYLAYRRQISKLDWAKEAIREVQECFKK